MRSWAHRAGTTRAPAQRKNALAISDILFISETSIRSPSLLSSNRRFHRRVLTSGRWDGICCAKAVNWKERGKNDASNLLARPRAGAGCHRGLDGIRPGAIQGYSRRRKERRARGLLHLAHASGDRSSRRPVHEKISLREGRSFSWQLRTALAEDRDRGARGTTAARRRAVRRLRGVAA